MKGTVYDKYVRLHNDFRKDFPKLGKQEIYKIVAKLSTWQYPKKRWKGQTLTKEEAMIYEWMLNHSYSPNTVYKWLLAMKTNKDVHEKLKKGTVSLNKAIKCARPFKHITEIEAEFMYHVKQSIQKYIIR